MFRSLIVFVSFLIALSPAFAGTPSLSVGKEVSGSLGSGEEATYTLKLGAEYFVYGAADQISVDVIIAVTGPDGTDIGTFDVTGTGPDYFQFQSTVKGKYTLTIKPFEDETGDFSLVIQMSEKVATKPKGKVDQLMVGMDNNLTPGVVVAVVEKGKISFKKAYGMANLSHSIEFTTETITNIGSTSKQFTAFGINLLAEEGKLSIDDDVRKYIPELPDFGEVVTIGHLLAHTSGYREFLNGIAMSGRMLDEGDYIGRQEIIDLVVRQPGLQNSPGSEWNYCNTGYAFLAVIIERISEQPFDVWMKENVFEPIGMKNTQVRMHRSNIIANSAQGYVSRPGGGFREVPDISGSAGAGGIYTTVADMALWMKNLHTGKVGGKEIIDRMYTPFVLTDGEESDYGMGLIIDEFRGLQRVSHGGADSAHRSMFMYFPEIDKGVITLSNHGGFSTRGATVIAENFFEEDLAPEVEEPIAEEGQLDEGSEEFDPESFTPEDFDEFVGDFQLENVPLVLSITREGDVFHVQATGQPRVTLAPTGLLEFNIVEVGAAINFHRDEDGLINSLTLHQGGGVEGHRVTEKLWAPDEEEMAGYAGRYFSSELEAFYEIVVQENALKLQHRRFKDENLNVVEIDKFRVGFPLGQITFVRGEDGDISGFTASNGRTLGVLFEVVPLNTDAWQEQ